jgi:flagellar protein FliS
LNAADHYLAEKVNTAAPAELTAMLFDKIVVTIKRGAQHTDNAEWEEARSRLLLAQRIVIELRSALRPDISPEAGEIAKNLDALYAWCYRRLIDANITRDSRGALDALTVMDELRTAWRQACLSPVAA